MGTRYNRLAEAVLTSTHNLCFEQKYEKYQNFLSENFQFLVVKFSIYLNRRVSVMEETFAENVKAYFPGIIGTIIISLLPNLPREWKRLYKITSICLRNFKPNYILFRSAIF